MITYNIHFQALKKVFASRIHDPLVSDGMMRKICEAKIWFVFVVEEDARSF